MPCQGDKLNFALQEDVEHIRWPHTEGNISLSRKTVDPTLLAA